MHTLRLSILNFFFESLSLAFNLLRSAIIPYWLHNDIIYLRLATPHYMRELAELCPDTGMKCVSPPKT
jgi:hypothetical protein